MLSNKRIVHFDFCLVRDLFELRCRYKAKKHVMISSDSRQTESTRACSRCLMTSKGVMHASLTIVAVAPDSAAPAKPVSALLPSHRLAASYTAKCTACDGLFRHSLPDQPESSSPVTLSQTTAAAP